jgi:SAM-dependent methyltransferase
MRASIATQLLEINRRFYGDFAEEYSRSRQVLQPGIPRALAALGAFESLLDLGCGDGRVGWAIAEGLLERRVERYVGVDLSPALLNQRGAPPGDGLGSWQGLVADITETGWEDKLRLSPGCFDATCCFSALHHIPGAGQREELLRRILALVRPGGHMALSVWQLSHHERFRRKIRAWSEAGMAATDVEPGDILVDWQRGGTGLRYVHEFSESELLALGEAAGWEQVDSYRSDGESADLGLYAVFRRL